jgi:hypothetical protein
MNSTNRSGSGNGAGLSNRVDDGKDRGIRPYSESQGCHSRDRKARALPENAKRMFNVLQERFHAS